MLDWLNHAVSSPAPLRPELLALRFAVSLLLGGVVALVYQLSHGRGRDESSTLPTTLVLIAVLIAMVSQVIGNNVALAFSLVGTLSIVRFRTVVADTRDAAFVIFAVVVGMAVGAGLPAVALVGIPLVALAAIVPGRLSSAGGAHTAALLQVRLPLGDSSRAALSEALAKLTLRQRQVAASTARQGAAIDLHYRITIPQDTSLADVVAELNRLEGVQNVELRED